MHISSILLAATLTLAAPAAFAQDFPVTIEHVWGQTEIEAKPTRIVTWGWVTQDVVLALGEVPVGMPYFAYGGDDEGMLAWTREALAASGQTTTILADTPEPPYEQILALEPDVILAVHPGVTQEQYQRLSRIAPTTAYPDAPWATPMDVVITMAGQAMGKSEQAEAMVAELSAYTATEVARFPALKDTTFASFRTGEGLAYIFNRNAAGVTFLEGLGLQQAQSVTNLDKGDSYYFELSFENFGALESDILVGFFDDTSIADSFLSHTYIQTTPQVAAGRVAAIIGGDLDVAISPPSPLSLKWALPRYLETIAAAVSDSP